MKCYYEILNICRDAEDDEIKAAYRKLALKWHPDKNLNNAEIAKERFQLVQQAYEILSDRQERAWYDKHREQILYGSNTEFQDKSLNVFQYFTTSCFKGFDDSENGFYTVYSNVFDQIAKEDLEFCEDKEEFCEIPQFGSSTSDYETVVKPFYNYWMGYSTKKSYVWLDPHNINEFRERRIAKMAEKENKKIRQKAKKERNEEIRNLVAFVKKRDKRVINWNKLNEARIQENRKKQEEKRKKQLIEQKKLNESGMQAEWTKFDNVQQDLLQIEKELNEKFGHSDSEDDLDALFCPACNKLFKNEKSFQNHELSKKHLLNVEKIKEELLLEEESFSDKESNTENELEDDSDIENLETFNFENNGISDNEDVQTRKKKLKKNKKILKAADLSLNLSESLQDKETNEPLGFLPSGDISDDEFSTGKCTKNKKKSRSKKGTNDKIKNHSVENADSTKPEKITVKDTAHELKCETCDSTYSSKNKLFQHLKETGHSVPISSNSCKPKGNKKKK